MKYIFPGYVEYYEENGSIYVLSKLKQNKVEISDYGLQKEFLRLFRSKGCQEIETPLTIFLHEQELLVNDKEINLALNQAKELLSEKLLLTIMPTEACNFRCPYCYETHKPTIMERPILNQIHSYITKQSPYFKEVCISWFGGEPTLCKDIILETADIVKKLQSQHGFRYSSNMTTNGYLLDVETFKQYYLAGIRYFQITLDGWNHDKTRPLSSGKGTLYTILSNLIDISNLPKNSFQFCITIRNNVLTDYEDLSWYDYLKKTFGQDERFIVAVAMVTDWGGTTVKTLNLAEKEQRNQVRTRHEEYLDRIGMARKDKETALLSNICYASCPNGFVFRSDGRIEKCTISLDNPKNLVGRIDPEKGVVLDEMASQKWCTNNINPKCYTCAEVLSCLNICCRKGVVIDGKPEGVCICEHKELSLE